MWEVEKILDHEVRKLRKRSLFRYLVKWKGFGHEHNTWVDDAAFDDCAPLESYWAAHPDRRGDAGS